MVLYKTLFQTAIAIFTPIGIIYFIVKLVNKIIPDEKDEEENIK